MYSIGTMEVKSMFTQKEIIEAAKKIGLSAEPAPNNRKSAFISPDGRTYEFTDGPLINIPSEEQRLIEESFKNIDIKEVSISDMKLDFEITTDSNVFIEEPVNNSLKMKEHKDASSFFMLLYEYTEQNNCLEKICDD